MTKIDMSARDTNDTDKVKMDRMHHKMEDAVKKEERNRCLGKKRNKKREGRYA